MNIVVFASGAGSNAACLFRDGARGRFGGAKFFLVSDNPDSGALRAAREMGIESITFNPGAPGARISPDAAGRLFEALEKINPTLVVLAGFMRIMPSAIVRAFDGRMINLHPSLLPLYKGKDSIRRAFEAGEKITGCTVHYVSDELDGGKIIAQKPVEILPGDSVESLTQRVHAAEHELLGSVVEKLIIGREARL